MESDKPEIKTVWVGGPPDLFKNSGVLTPWEKLKAKNRQTQQRRRARLKLEKAAVKEAAK